MGVDGCSRDGKSGLEICDVVGGVDRLELRPYQNAHCQSETVGNVNITR